jgi:ectoine hydroxylase
MKWIDTYTGFLRNIRLFHFIFNYINRDKLQHNKDLYKKYQINKSIYRSISSKDFENKQAKLPWLDYPTKLEEIKNHPKFLKFDENIQQTILQWHNNGSLILRSYIENDVVQEINQDIDYLLATEIVNFNYTKRKIINAFEHAPSIQKIIHSKKITRILSFILDKEVIPFQTINFLQGSEQAAHSDWLHMSTFPKGYLIAVWIALEDIEIDAGAIAYYPGSHRLPYLNNKDIGAKNNFLYLDRHSNQKFEQKISTLLLENNFKKEPFIAKKGDVFIWHANLIHEGLPIKNKVLSRKSMVIHYFAKEVICYHEISERPALINPKV